MQTELHLPLHKVGDGVGRHLEWGAGDSLDAAEALATYAVDLASAALKVQQLAAALRWELEITVAARGDRLLVEGPDEDIRRLIEGGHLRPSSLGPEEGGPERLRAGMDAPLRVPPPSPN